MGDRAPIRPGTPAGMPPLAPLCLLGTLPQCTAPRLAAKRKHGSWRQEGKSKWALRPAWLGPHGSVTSGGAPAGL